jgi:GTPase SAR1 family protein
VKKGKGNDLPKVTAALLAQDASRRLLEEALHPWRVTRLTEQDFGRDALVEITEPIRGSRDEMVTGRMFTVQLKATESSQPPRQLRVTVGHLKQWHGGSLPLLLVSVHLPTRMLMGRWIDDELLAELRDRSPLFLEQSTVSVRLDQVIDGSGRQRLAEVVGRGGSRRRLVDPEAFFALQTRANRLCDDLASAAELADVRSVQNMVTRARAIMTTAPYRVAVVGPQRVGKSTLVNALIGRDISPVADYPTTAVPIEFRPGPVPRAVVHHRDGRTQSVPATSDALRPFAAQKDDEVRADTITRVEVEVVSDELARGLVLLDTPGLGDASEDVRLVAEEALRSADAVLYVLDASLDRKFKLGQAETEELARLTALKDRVFILLNQADALSLDRRQSLLDYVSGHLRKYGIDATGVAEPRFLSGGEAWRARERKRTPPAEFITFEHDLWELLLSSGSTGLYRILATMGEVIGAAEQGTALLGEAVGRSADAASYEAAALACRAARAEVHRLLADWDRNVQAVVRDRLRSRTEVTIRSFDGGLVRLSQGQPVPTADGASRHLARDMREHGRAVLQEVETDARALRDQVRALVESALSKGRAELGMPQTIDLTLTPMTEIARLNIESIDPVVGMGLGALGFFVNPITGIIGALAGLIMGTRAAEEKRRQGIAKLKARFKDAAHQSEAVLEREVMNRIAAMMDALGRDAIARLETFEVDAGARVERLGRSMLPAQLAAVDRARDQFIAVGRRARALSEEMSSGGLGRGKNVGASSL